VSAPEPGDGGWAGDVELDLLLLGVKASALNALDTTLDIAAGLAAIRVQPGRGTASRPPPARAGPGAQRKAAHHDQLISHGDHFDETEGHLS
jgi:hypothetical protein